MARGMPSMVALLGLLALAGYQNRDKIGEALGGLKRDATDPGTGLGGLAGTLGGLFSASSGGGGLGGLLGGLGGGGLSSGLGELLDSFKAAGHGNVAQSWIDPAVATQGLTPEQVRQAVGEDNLAELSQRTGLSTDDLLQRLSTAIPRTVDTLTPDGQMPTEEQLRQRLLPAST